MPKSLQPIIDPVIANRCPRPPIPQCAPDGALTLAAGPHG